MTSGEGVPGNDWALIRIDPAVAAEVGRQPGDARHRRPERRLHGLRPGRRSSTTATATASPSARARSRAASRRTGYDDGYGWTGVGAPGDSGSGVLTAAGGPAVGDFTHLIVDIGAYPGTDLAGTRITKILSQFGVSLVNADGSTTAPRPPAAAKPRARPSTRGQILQSSTDAGKQDLTPLEDRRGSASSSQGVTWTR